MSSHSEETPPPPPLSEAPPFYYSRDSLVDPYPPLNPPHVRNPQFEQGYHSPSVSGNETSNDNGESREDLPPPYSPGLGAIFSTGLSHHDMNDAPPSYYSLFGQIREAREQSTNNLVFLRKVGQIVLNTVGCTILLLVFMSVPITILVIGSIFVRNCPQEPFIPIYLIVGGISGILKNVLLIVENVVQRYSDQIQSRVKNSKYAVLAWRAFNLVFNLFMLSWTIAGGYWVYHIYNEVTNSEYSQCSELLYKFGFGIVTSSYILLLLTCACVCCCAGICLKMNKRRLRGGSVDSRSEPGSIGESEDDNRSLSIGVDSEQEAGEGEESDEGSVSVDGEYMMNTLTTTVENSTDHSGEEFLRRFRRLDSPPAFDTGPPSRGATSSILQYDSSPYPGRHAGILRVEHSPLDYPTHSSQHTPVPNSPHSRNHQINSRQVGPESSDSSTNRDTPIVDNPHEGIYRGENGLYITISSEGYSVTEV